MSIDVKKDFFALFVWKRTIMVSNHSVLLLLKKRAASRVSPLEIIKRSINLMGTPASDKRLEVTKLRVFCYVE